MDANQKKNLLIKSAKTLLQDTLNHVRGVENYIPWSLHLHLKQDGERLAREIRKWLEMEAK